jgi:hypothetical protein
MLTGAERPLQELSDVRWSGTDGGENGVGIALKGQIAQRYDAYRAALIDDR